MVVMNIPERFKWMPGLQKVEQDAPEVFIGSTHRCTFDDYDAIASPLRMTLSEDGIIYAESCRIDKMDLSLVYEFVFKKIDKKACMFAARVMNADESPIPERSGAIFSRQMQQMAQQLKEYCEKMEESSF